MKIFFAVLFLLGAVVAPVHPAESTCGRRIPSILEDSAGHFRALRACVEESGALARKLLKEHRERSEKLRELDERLERGRRNLLLESLYCDPGGCVDI